MQMITLQIEDGIYDKFLWLLNHFSKQEVTVLDKSEYISDDTYLRGLDGVVESIKDARDEHIENGVTLDKLEW